MNWKINSYTELQETIKNWSSRVDPFVRTLKIEEEKLVLTCYLQLVYIDQKLFPLDIVSLSQQRKDPPDFIINFCIDLKIGVEIVTATIQELKKQRVDKIYKPNFRGSYEELKNGTVIPHRKGEKLIGSGFYGKETAYKESAKYIYNWIKNKTEKLVEMRKKNLSEYHLVIYPSLPRDVFVIDRDLLINEIEKEIQSHGNFRDFFDRVMIVHENPLFLLKANNINRYKYYKEKMQVL